MSFTYKYFIPIFFLLNRNICRLPEWTKDVFFPGCELEQLTAAALGIRAATKLLARLKYGFLFRDILDRFTMSTNKELSPNRSLWVYSAHDHTIAGLLKTMDLFQASFFSKLTVFKMLVLIINCH